MTCSAPPSHPHVFCVPGRDETFEEAFGRLTWNRPVAIGAVDVTASFARLAFAEQVATVLRHLRPAYWHEEALVLGRSFGAWILLQGLMQQDERYPGTVILLAGVLGYGQHRGLQFIAPRAATFWDAVAARSGAPARMFALLHGRHDDQCPLTYAEELSTCWDVPLHTFNAGHDVGKDRCLEEVSAAIHALWHPAPSRKREA